jgi:hypothetical protein
VLEGLFGSGAALERSELHLQRLLQERGIFFGEKILPTFAFAFVSSQPEIERWAHQAQLVIAAAEYAAQDILEQAASCDTLNFTSDVQDLIYAWPGYKRVCVICRPDAIPVGEDINFVELNCDSPAMMMFLDIVTQCLLELEAFAPVRERIQTMSASESLLRTLLECYREYAGATAAHPTIAITDWEGQKTRFEHQRLAEFFQSRGYETIVCDPRSFRYVNKRLHVDGKPVQIVYRRALASELIRRREDAKALLQAYQDGAICMVNPLRSYVASAKSLLSRIVESELPPELAEAAQLIPQTVILDDPEVRTAIRASAAQWALKRSEGHGGMNVVLPLPSNEAAWQDAWVKSASEVWIAQQFLDVPRISLPEVDGPTVSWSEKFYNWNPFVFGGRYAGGLVRVSNTPLINITLGGGLMPTLVRTR